MTERTKPADTTEENDESGKDGAQQIILNGENVTSLIRTEEVGNMASS